MSRFGYVIPLLVFTAVSGIDCRNPGFSDVLKLPSDSIGGDDSVGTRWAVLIAGSSGYSNYRHQADVCHAYQTLRRGGLKEENIVVFMYDDIAYNEENPRPGIIINHPQGGDVYAGVPKDYVGEDVNVGNFFAVLLGNKTALTGGSGKVVDSDPDDHIFVFYSDHGGPGVLGMPTYPYLYGNDLIDVLKKKHASRSYKSLVFYLEACESGSIFEGLLPKGLNIYATTASNATESSWGMYCPGYIPSPPPEYGTCLGDLYSVSWMEDSDAHNLQTETLKLQYQLVKSRTSNQKTYRDGSHVMQYGDLGLSKENVFLYIGSDPANDNATYIDDNSLPTFTTVVNQRDADLVYYWNKFRKSPEGSSKKHDAQRELLDMMAHRLHVDNSMELIGKLLFGSEKGLEVLKSARPKGLPLVDDWDCLKTMVYFCTWLFSYNADIGSPEKAHGWIGLGETFLRLILRPQKFKQRLSFKVRTFEKQCGSLSQYGMKHMRSFANICNAGVSKEAMAAVSSNVCVRIPKGPWSSLQRGYSA